MTATHVCLGCDYETPVVYDAACHFYSLGPPHLMVTQVRDDENLA